MTDAKSDYLKGFEAAVHAALAEVDKLIQERDSDDYALLVHVYNRIYDMQGRDEPWHDWEQWNPAPKPEASQ